MRVLPIRVMSVSVLCVGVVGCATPEIAIPIHQSIQLEHNQAKSTAPETPIQQVKAEVPISEKVDSASNTDSTVPPPSSTSASLPKPNYAQLETLPIDLATVIRIVDEQSPAVGIAQAKVRQAQARLDKAEVQWLPNLSIGMAYTRFDGQTQNQRGDVFGVSRANLFAGGGPALTIDFGDAIYRPLIERRMFAAESLRAKATTMQTEFESVGAYLDLLQIYAQLEINDDTLKKAVEMAQAAQNAKDAKLDRTAGDVNRAQAEVLFRRAERLDLQIKAGNASSKLVRLLLLPPSTKLVPIDITVTPLYFIDPNSTLDQLISLAIANRPDLGANRELLAAAWAKVRQQQRGPLFPKLTVANQTGGYGGGLNDDLQNFDARNALSVQLFWEVRSLGLTNRADTAERRAQFDEAQYQLLDAQAKAASEIVEAAQVASLKHEALELAEQTVKEATELYRINKDGTLNVVDAKNLFDALRPLQAIQVLNQARQNYLAAVIDFNRSQYRLFTLIGNAPRLTNP